MGLSKRVGNRGSGKGQGIIEYILLLTIVIVLLLVFFRKQGFFQDSFNEVIATQADEMVGVAEQVFIER